MPYATRIEAAGNKPRRVEFKDICYALSLSADEHWLAAADMAGPGDFSYISLPHPKPDVPQTGTGLA